jgi:signal transduction histidine kinase
MKPYVAITMLLVALAFSAGYLVVEVHRGAATGADSASTHDIASLISAIDEQLAAERTIRLDELYPFGESSQFLHPQWALPRTFRFPYEDIRRLYEYSSTCSPSLIPKDSPAELGKSWEWSEVRCGHRAAPAAEFFSTPPFFDPFGDSFAYMAAQLALKDGARYGAWGSDEWLTAHLPVMHATELRHILPRIGAAGGKYEAISRLSPQQLAGLAEGHEAILGSETVFLRRPLALRFDPETAQVIAGTIEYRILSRDKWDAALKGWRLTATEAPGRDCLSRSGAWGLCWQARVDRSEARLIWATRAMLGAAILLLLTFIGLSVREYGQRLASDKARAFALSMLTHELRTPVASLLVTSERGLGRFDSLPDAARDIILSVANDARRLQRLTETSQQYLASVADMGGLRLRRDASSSLNEFVAQVVGEFDERVRFEPASEAVDASFDRFWVGICLKNLISNGLQHGRAPVVVRTMVSRTELGISVEDQGAGPEARSWRSSRFERRPESEGLGLGLFIVETVSKALGARLEVRLGPTKFSLLMKRYA